MTLGFTGTRRGMTAAQRETLRDVIASLPAGAVHGGAEGADGEFDDFLRAAGLPGTLIAVYALPRRQRFWLDRVAPTELVLRPSTGHPLVRNRLIVKASDHLLAAPAQADETLRSGTWATVRYARAAGKPITILLPEGGVREEKR